MEIVSERPRCDPTLRPDILIPTVSPAFTDPEKMRQCSLWRIDRGPICTKIVEKGRATCCIFSIAKSSFHSHKTFLKADLFLRNWRTSTLLLGKRNLFSLLSTFDIRLIIFVICFTVAPHDPGGRLEAYLPRHCPEALPQERAPAKQTSSKQICKTGLGSRQKSLHKPQPPGRPSLP